MPTLAKFLENKGYTDNEIEETLIRFDLGMKLPECVSNDIDEYFNYFLINF